MRTCLVIVISFALSTITNANQSEASSIPELVGSATELIQSLDKQQRSAALLPFENEARVDWHYIPKERKGLSLKSMSTQQRELSMMLLKGILSQAGYKKLKGVMESERILWLISNKSDHRDPENYHLTIFGKPDTKSSWGISFEGHHLSINLSVIDGHEVYVTPSFMGSNPETSESGHQPLSGEMNSAHELFNSLNTQQKAKAALEGKMPREILTRADPKVEALSSEGLPVIEMDQLQRKLVQNLISEYIDRYREAFAKDDWEKIEAAGFDKVKFVWTSADPPSRAIYYRVQGPTFVIEYANSQNHGNHSHSVWRDFENDFGYDALRAHLNSDN